MTKRIHAGEKSVAITGIGLSEITRGATRSGFAMTVSACLDAIEDAGLDRSRIDGLASWPGVVADSSGKSPVAIPDLKIALGLNLNWYSAGGELPGQLGAVVNAIGAISAGLANHVLVFRVSAEAAARRTNRFAMASKAAAARVGDYRQWMAPFYVASGTTMWGLAAQRHFHEFGTKPEQMAQIALNGRRNAQKTPGAIYRSPLTMDDYLNSRLISDPLRLFDCDVPVDGAAALVISRLDEARDLKNPVIRFEAVGSAMHDDTPIYFSKDFTSHGEETARMMWSRTDLKPKDVDVAELYDGFSIITMAWLEALGFCGRGESGPFIEGGQRIALEGELPLNTDGGQLSFGRLHGYGLLREACVQLRGQGGEHQVPNDPKVAAVAVRAGPSSSCMLLIRD